VFLRPHPDPTVDGRAGERRVNGKRIEVLPAGSHQPTISSTASRGARSRIYPDRRFVQWKVAVQFSRPHYAEPAPPSSARPRAD
jgi:hypothetical protein